MENVKKPIVKLIGADSNAFMIMGLCFKAARKAGWSQAQLDVVKKEMTSGDYNNLICVAMEHFDVR